MKAITLTNPSGLVKELTGAEFYNLQIKYVKCKAFRDWSERRHISGWVKHDKEERISPTAVNMFLRESGYQIIDNLHT